ncbi:MAG: hypothetical protein J6W03_06200 [Bacteroidaceae bacterium]|nr:hypothetical protein [Bacteroidaceae bacterium]
MAQNMQQNMNITIGGQTQSVVFEDNDATRALAERLMLGPVTVTLNSSGGFEIWGSLGFSLPTSNQQINAGPGDVVLYNGSNICIFYGTNSWSYTRLGKIDGLTGAELRSFLRAGESGISVTLSLPSDETGIHPLSPAPKSDENTYSPDGKKVGNPSKGIYIKDGKKVIL